MDPRIRIHIRVLRIRKNGWFTVIIRVNIEVLIVSQFHHLTWPAGAGAARAVCPAAGPLRQSRTSSFAGPAWGEGGPSPPTSPSGLHQPGQSGSGRPLPAGSGRSAPVLQGSPAAGASSQASSGGAGGEPAGGGGPGAAGHVGLATAGCKCRQDASVKHSWLDMSG